MSNDWNVFARLSALTGGALTGIAAAIFVLLNARIAGIGGLVGGLLNPRQGGTTWRAQIFDPGRGRP